MKVKLFTTVQYVSLYQTPPSNGMGKSQTSGEATVFSHEYTNRRDFGNGEYCFLNEL